MDSFLFPGDYEKNCRNCIYKTTLTVNNDIFCKYKGIVSPEFLCRKFHYDVFTVKHKKKRVLDTAFKEEDFEL